MEGLTLTACGKNTQLSVDTGSMVSIMKNTFLLPLLDNILLRTMTGEMSAALDVTEVKIELGWLRIQHRI